MDEDRDEGYIDQDGSDDDAATITRKERGAHPRPRGRAPKGKTWDAEERATALEAKLTDLQCRRFARAYNERGADAVDGIQQVLTSLLNEDVRSELEREG